MPDAEVNAARAVGIPFAVAALLAHQGGWDEFLLVAAPMAVIVGLLWLARRRVTRAAVNRDGED